MSEENVEIVREVLRHWRGGRWAWAQAAHAKPCEVVFSTSWFPDWFPEADAFGFGREALASWIAWTERFKEFRADVDEIVDAGEQVVLLISLWGRGRASPASDGASLPWLPGASRWVLDAEVGAIVTVQGWKVVRWELTDRGRALEAAGLRDA